MATAHYVINRDGVFYLVIWGYGLKTYKLKTSPSESTKLLTALKAICSAK